MSQGSAEAIAMIEKFIAFDTTSRDSNLPLIDFVADYLDGLGAETQIIRNEAGDKANLLARIGPNVEGGVILSGHTDTVPVADQIWTSDPYRLERRDDKLYGRGTTDMKSFLAICTSMAPRFAAANLREPIYLAMSYDEEIGCLGVPSLIDRLHALQWRPRACIVGEPSGMDVLIGHMGAQGFETVVTGRDAHSSQMGFGVNAIALAAELIRFLDGLVETMGRDAATDPLFGSTFVPVNIGVIEGGTACNIVAQKCSFTWTYRDVPGTDRDAVVNRLRDYVDHVLLPSMGEKGAAARVETCRTIDFVGLRPDPGNEAEALALRCSGANGSRVDVFGTEAGLFQQAGIATVVCGPGDIAQAHRPDEYLSVEQVGRCEQFLDRLMEELAQRRN